METTWDIVVIGGGPAGMMAAGRAAERARGQGRELRILLLEKNDGLGKKLLITGGGRCNLTNDEPDARALLAKFKGSDKFLFSAFAQHGVRETLDFFHGHGMQTKVEEGRRVFPVSDSARSVWEVMRKHMNDGRVTVRSNAEVTGFVTNERGSIEAVRLKGTKNITSGEIIRGRAFILATGGKSHPETGSTGEGFGWLTALGHKVSAPSSALVPVTVSDAWVKTLSGISLKDAKITLFQDGAKAPGKESVNKGKVLFTHFGMSGPAVLNMSGEIGELLKYGKIEASFDLLPDLDYSAMNSALQVLMKKESNKKFKNILGTLIPSPLVPMIMEKSGIDPDTFCHSVTREERLGLVKLLKDVRVNVTGLLGSDKAIVTSGGVALEEIDFRTMRSRLVPDLYLVGDILDIDRPSGGYSLQLCWTTGWVAGNSAAEAVVETIL